MLFINQIYLSFHWHGKRTLKYVNSAYNELLSRYQQDIGQQTTTKIKTLVKTGNRVDNDIMLTVNDRNYRLQSVIFHIGEYCLNKVNCN